MGIFVANKAARLMTQNGLSLKGARSLILGITFKENCPDIRNSKVPDICEELEIFGMKVSVFDPYASMTEVEKEFGIKLISELIDYDLIILAVAHDKFLNINIDRLKKRDGAVVFDLKSFLDKKKVDARL